MNVVVPYWKIFCDGWEFYVGVVIIYWVTLAAFPALCVLIQSPSIDPKSENAAYDGEYKAPRSPSPPKQMPLIRYVH